MRRMIATLACLLTVGHPAAAIESMAPIEGPVIHDSKSITIHPLELIGEVRNSRAHWYTPKLGQKHFVYTVAENRYHYTSTKKIPLVFDRRPWSKKHPIFFGAYEISRVSAGALITSAFAWLAAKK